MDRMLKQDKLERAIRSIRGDYLFIFEVNLRENTYLSLINTDGMGFTIPEEGVYSSLNERICGCVSEEYRGIRRAFGSVENLRRRLAEEEAAECEYQAGTGQTVWWKDSFRVIEYDREEPVKAVWEHAKLDRQGITESEQQAFLAAYRYEEAAGRARNEFCKMIYGDLKNQMNKITGMTAIANSFLNDAECVRDSLDTIKHTIRQMYLLFHCAGDILTLEAGSIETDNGVFSLPDALRATADALGREIKAHGHTLTMDTAGVIHDNVQGDEAHIRQIVTCLLHNAVSYTNEGGTIHISMSEQVQAYQGYRMYEITIEDNGIGMSELFQKIMFDPFTREEDFPFGNIEGNGLGLMLARSMARVLGGDVTIESQKGTGTRAKVLLKLLPEENRIKNIQCI